MFFERLEFGKTNGLSIVDVNLKFIKRKGEVTVVGTVEYLVDAGDDVEVSKMALYYIK